jgi:hypothetical protein
MTAAEKNRLKTISAGARRSADARPLAADLAMGAVIGLVAGALPALNALDDDGMLAAAGVWLAAALIGVAIAAIVDWRRSRPVRARRALYEW